LSRPPRVPARPSKASSPLLVFPFSLLVTTSLAYSSPHRHHHLTTRYDHTPLITPHLHPFTTSCSCPSFFPFFYLRTRCRPLPSLLSFLFSSLLERKGSTLRDPPPIPLLPLLPTVSLFQTCLVLFLFFLSFQQLRNFLSFTLCSASVSREGNTVVVVVFRKKLKRERTSKRRKAGELRCLFRCASTNSV
jgi:hypothetical protein